MILFLFFIVGLWLSNLTIDKVQNDLVVGKVILIAITPLEYFYTQIKVAMLIALTLSFPFILYHLICYIRPALKRKERIAITFILPSIIVLFIIGICFSYFIILKFAINFFSNLALQAGVANLWTIDRFLSFVLTTCLVFGIVFQLPLLLIVLSKLDILSIDILKKQRKYVYVLMFVIAAIITPPDVFTQLMIVFPLILLYELSLVLIRIIKPSRK